ncbi:hypothetical protein WK66_17295 [Burkholderia ubonensis]|uniref:hypothetical protein n=1 Tax=Burkholderia ubonensis TaxID=101571 RepID=UPI000755515E|nr:hypothetical protein [Burkholderia ubonensis]KVU44440.1 hypothetical protein WK66_17295 [Burkholderia ubonensis]
MSNVSDIRACWAVFWFEPWLGTHPSWLEASSPPGWAALTRKGRAACRSGYEVWCDHFGLAGYPHSFDTFGLDVRTQRPLYLLDTVHQPEAAVDLGLTVLASEQSFAAAWVKHKRKLLEVATSERWRAAIMRARVRRLPHPWRVSADACERSDIDWACAEIAGTVGAAWMRIVAESRWPSTWERLRLALPRGWVDAVDAAEQELDHEQVPSSIRQAVRIWAAHGELDMGRYPV